MRQPTQMVWHRVKQHKYNSNKINLTQDSILESRHQVSFALIGEIH